MGLSSSKRNASNQSQPSPSGCAAERTRSRALNGACRGSKRFDADGGSHDSDLPSEENGGTTPHPHANKPGSSDYNPKDQTEQTIDELIESNVDSAHKFRGPNACRSLYSRSLNASGRFLSRFGNLSFRLTRSRSLNSWRPRQACFSNPNEEEEEDYTNSSRIGPVVTNANRRACEFLPSCFVHRSPRAENETDESNDFHNNDRLNPTHHSESILRGNDDAPALASAREPAERRFSRTLSVGRLRDRVLRGLPVSASDLQSFRQERELGRARRFNTHGQGLEEEDEESSRGPLSSPPPDNIATRRTGYRDLMDYRSSFIERRRRIRSQVRALQRLGSRFENLPARERSCILSGQHRSGHCTCDAASNSNDDANARASISRIVMLAEALFEVLDEIHQQSIVRSSVSSIGSVPAPNEAVDSLPLKVFRKLKKVKTSEEAAAQCYICLVEYEDGDIMRILPCHHEFHRSCVDKWLKEIHRVCPLCRGDICHATQ